MAILHTATIQPSKLELLSAWLPTRSWYPGGTGELERVSACRFDDPDGEVGIEIFLARHGDGPVLHAPMTYRGAPLEGAEQWLIGTMEHSVLGSRWVYDACGDPVYVQALATAILTGGTEAEEFVETDGAQKQRDPAMTVRGTGAPGTPVPSVKLISVGEGDPAIVVTDELELVVARVLGGDTGTGPALVGEWPGSDGPTTLARLRAR